MWSSSGVTYFARYPLRSYFHDPQKNEIYFLNEYFWAKIFSFVIWLSFCFISGNELSDIHEKKLPCCTECRKVFQSLSHLNMSHLMTKPTKWHVRSVKTPISLGIRPVWSESSLCAQWLAKDPSFLHADSEDWWDWVDAKADLSLHWAHMPFCWFCHERAHFALFQAMSRQISLRRNYHVVLSVIKYFSHRLIWIYTWGFTAVLDHTVVTYAEDPSVRKVTWNDMNLLSIPTVGLMTEKKSAIHKWWIVET